MGGAQFEPAPPSTSAMTPQGLTVIFDAELLPVHCSLGGDLRTSLQVLHLKGTGRVRSRRGNFRWEWTSATGQAHTRRPQPDQHMATFQRWRHPPCPLKAALSPHPLCPAAVRRPELGLCSLECPQGPLAASGGSTLHPLLCCSPPSHTASPKRSSHLSFLPLLKTQDAFAPTPQPQALLNQP